jgi:hypothetical protein
MDRERKSSLMGLSLSESMSKGKRRGRANIHGAIHRILMEISQMMLSMVYLMFAMFR